eukprot:9546727-Alexandrium_andersonii.AAC.1
MCIRDSPRDPRLAPPAQAASPGGLPPPQTAPKSASGAPEALFGAVRGGGSPPGEAARAGGA